MKQKPGDNTSKLKQHLQMQMILVNTENTFIGLFFYNIEIACRNVLNTKRNFQLEIFHDGACC